MTQAQFNALSKKHNLKSGAKDREHRVEFSDVGFNVRSRLDAPDCRILPLIIGIK
jgi:hypothetical protein